MPLVSLTRNGNLGKESFTMRIRARMLLASAAAISGAVFAAPVATADDVGVLSAVEWTRSCGTTYSGVSSAVTGYANTVKYSGGSCKGDAWLRVQTYGVWGSWRHNSSTVYVYVAGLTAAQHKGCADCTIYTTYP